MNRKQGWGPVAVATVGLAIATLSACEGGVQLDQVEGNRDDLRYVAPVYKTRTVDVKQRQCRWVSETSTKFVNGKSKTETKMVNKCRSVKVGTRQEKYQAKAPKWCVELDALNGEATKNDQWFRVDYGTYQLAGEMTEGSSIKFTPLAQGC